MLSKKAPMNDNYDELLDIQLVNSGTGVEIGVKSEKILHGRIAQKQVNIL